MAAQEQKAYPMMPGKNWWALRRKFRLTIPVTVKPSYVASALGVSEPSARHNILPALKKTGIVDDDGKTGDRAKKWRDDKQYPEVCAAILNEVYPQELRDLAPDASANREQVESWFGHDTGAGASAVHKMAAFYVRLLEADPSKDPGEGRRAPAAKAKGKGKLKKTQAKKIEPKDELPPAGDDIPSRGRPSIHFDVQIHISPDSTPEQIDKVFESMAKHLKGLG